MTLLGPRRHRSEILDEGGQDHDELDRSLAHVSAVNRWLGGDRALRLHLDAVLDEADGPAWILDVGVGDAGLLRRLHPDCGPETRFVGVEIHPQIVRIAHARIRDHPGVHLVRADGLRLPFDDDAFHATVCTLTLHHFRKPEAEELLLEMARVASLRILVNDLERNLANYLGARLLARTVWRSCRITKNDGPLSVLRSFTPEELERLGNDAGLARVSVRRRFPFRLVLDALPPERPATPDARGA